MANNAGSNFNSSQNIARKWVFMEAKLGTIPLLFGEALLSSKEVLNKGVGWRVGCGVKILKYKNYLLQREAKVKMLIMEGKT